MRELSRVLTVRLISLRNHDSCRTRFGIVGLAMMMRPNRASIACNHFLEDLHLGGGEKRVP